MEYQIDLDKDGDLENFVKTINEEDFIPQIKIREYFYRCEYTFKSSKKKSNNEFCIPALKQRLATFIDYIYGENEILFRDVVTSFAKINENIGGKIYPPTIAWLNDENPCGIDIAYALSLLNIDNCCLFGDYLLYNDPDHCVHQIDCINSLLEKYGVQMETVYLTASFSVHGTRPFDNTVYLLTESKFAEDFSKTGNKNSFFNRLNYINIEAKGSYDEDITELKDILQPS